MANKRQRLARKRFQEASGTVIVTKPKSSSTTTTQDKQKSHKKRKREDGGEASPQGGRLARTGKLKKLKRHPLRVPGKKPGEGCFICRSQDHIAKQCPQKFAKDRKKVCLFCRELGHSLNHCPARQETQETKFCYNCGEVGHRLAECKKPLKDGGTTFAECFLCKQKGHLSKNCPSNTHGIYPKGGSCKICGGVTHLAKDCPQKGTAKLDGTRHMKLQISKEAAPSSKRIVFGSGDDLEDDFGNLDGGLPVGSEDEEAPQSGKRIAGKTKKVSRISPGSIPGSMVKNYRKKSTKLVKFT